MTAIIGAMSDVWDLVGTTITQITTQPILLFLLAAGFVPIGISLFKKLKKSVR